MDKLLKNLEYDKVLDIISAYTVSAAAKTDIYQLIQPQKTLSEANLLLDQSQEAYKLYYQLFSRPITAFDDSTDVIAKSKVSALLTFSELRRIMSLLRSGRIAKQAIEGAAQDMQLTHLVQITATYQGDNQLEKEIESCIISDSEISDNASSNLKEIRKKLLNARAALNEKLKQFFKKSDISDYLQGDLVTVREGRYVLPVKSEYRSMVQGLVHDRSSSGSTVFIEPFSVVEMNNGIKSLRFEEQQEIDKIIKRLTASVAAIVDDLAFMQEALVRLDVIFAKIHFAAAFNCNRPLLNDKGHVRLIASRHPLIDKNKVVPVTMEFGISHRILMVTGPNTGGKTVALKTAGLFCLLASSGIFLPAADQSIVSVFTNVFSDIGDEQSISSSLSTFSSHIVNINNIISNIDKNSLVLLDELGGGTDPEEGAALAIGILKFLELSGCCAIITTHYGQLKEYALTSKTIKNASMQFDYATLKPTYKLVMNLPGSSNALKIAKTLGMNEYILKEAYNSMAKEKITLDEVLSNAEMARIGALKDLEAAKTERLLAEKLRYDLTLEKEKLAEQLFKIKQNAKAEVKRIASSSLDTASALIDEIKQKLDTADEKALLEAKRLYKKIEDIGFIADDDSDIRQSCDYVPFKKGELRAGMAVYIVSLGVQGKVLSVNEAKNEASVQAGVAVSNIKLDNLAKPDIYLKTEKKKAIINTSKKEISSQPINQEINVIGHTVDEATTILDAKIQELSGMGEVVLRIIHGKGSGVLGRGIQSYLRTFKNILSFRYGRYGEGETGVTIVEFL